MDTLFINGRFLVQRLTGVQRFAREIVSAIDARLAAAPQPFDCIVVAPRGDIDPPPWSRVRVRQGGRLSGHLWDQVDLPRLAAGGALLSLCNVGPVMHARHALVIHDAAVYARPDAFTLPYRIVYRILHPLLSRRAAQLLTVSRFSRSELIAHLRIPEQRLRVIGEGANHILRHPAATQVTERYGLRRNGYLLAVGSANPNKNFATVVAAFAALDRSDLQLVVVGGQDPHVFAGTRPAGIRGVVTLGAIDDAELRALYESALCFVFPTYYEGFGLPAIEAMACGCPVIASTAGAVREVCDDAVLYAEPGDPGAWAAQIARLATDEALCSELRQRGLERVRRFSWPAAADDILAAMQPLLRH